MINIKVKNTNQVHSEYNQDSINNPAVIPDNYIAALDIGSNSFHFVYGRLIDNHLQILHTEKYRVKLATGLDKNNILSNEAITRGVATLENLSATVKNLNEINFRVVATYTLRKAKNSQTFLDEASKVFPFDIEIISGHEEARLIYQGVIHTFQPKGNHLVIDIGGGSTEIVIGKNQQIKTLSSLTMGCVSFSQTYFPNKTINEPFFNHAISAAKKQINTIVKRFKKISWQTATGTSGTIKSIYHLVHANASINKNTNPQTINLEQLYQLKKQLLTFTSSEEISLEGLKENRRDVICAGLAILIALMESLEIDELYYCNYSLREGVIYEQLEQLSLCSNKPVLENSIAKNLENKPLDIHQRTVSSLIERFAVDLDQANSVHQLSMILYQKCAKNWGINERRYKKILSWAAQLHEIGFNINAANYHKHGQYIIENADLAGFNQEQQYALAWLIGSHRKKISLPQSPYAYQLKNKILSKISTLLRLAVILNQQRQLSEPSIPIINVNDKSIELIFKKQWLIERPLVDSDLFFEQQALQAIDIELIIKT